MTEIKKEMVLIVSEDDPRELYSIRQMVDGSIVFVSGTIDANTLDDDHKVEMVRYMQERFNPNNKEVKQ